MAPAGELRSAAAGEGGCRVQPRIPARVAVARRPRITAEHLLTWRTWITPSVSQGVLCRVTALRHATRPHSEIHKQPKPQVTTAL
jgi:hypothetical protein